MNVLVAFHITVQCLAVNLDKVENYRKQLGDWVCVLQH